MSLAAGLVVLLLAAAFSCHEENAFPRKLRAVYSWKSLDFAFGREFPREAAIKSKRFRPGASIPIDVDVYYGPLGQVVFVAMPRLEHGVPATVGYVTDELSEEGNPLVAPYPDWQWNKLGDCDAITSVYRVQIDKCDRLWVLDTGVVGDQRICPPQLLVFDLGSDRLLSRYRFPREQYRDGSLLVTPVVDVRRSTECGLDTFVYIADVTSFSLLVYDHYRVRSWRVSNNLFYPYPHHGTFTIRDETFDLMDGVLGLALGPLQQDGDRVLYFHSLASRTESWVATSVVRNHSLFRDNPDAAARSFRYFPLERSSQSAAEAMDRDGVLFFGLLGDLAVGCWNSRHFPQFGGANLETLIVDEDALQFPSGLKVVTGHAGRQELWVSTASFQRYMSGTLHPNETNFRIQAGFVDELVRGTKCDVKALDVYSQANYGRPPA